MEQILNELKVLPRKILRHLENEFEVLVEEKPELKTDLDLMYKRIRKNILDAIGDCRRKIERLE